MKTSHTFSIALLAIAAAAGARAQTTPAVSSNAAGLLGQRYAEVSVGAIDPHGTSDEGFTADGNVNLPIQAGLDLGFGYSYDRLNLDLGNSGLKQRSRDHTIYSSVTAYSTYAGVKPFGSAALGYQWNRNKLDFGGARVVDDREDEGVWSLAVGAEVPVGPVTVTPKIAYEDGFKKRSIGAFTYGAQASMWFTPKVGGFAEATYVDPTGGATQSWVYKIGARFRF
jgi:hypothetical protein